MNFGPCASVCASCKCDQRRCDCCTVCYYFNARRRRVSEVNNRIAWLPASAPFLTMTAAAAVRRPGGCRPSRRLHRVVLVGDNSGIDDGNKFGKLFITFLTSLMGGHIFLLLQVTDSSDRTDRSKLRALLQTISLSMMIILVILFASTIFFLFN